MDTAKHILLFSVGIILTVGFIAIAMTIFNKSRTSISNTNAQYDSLVSQYSEIEYALYENAGSTASGSEVSRLIKGLDDDSIHIFVKNGAYKESDAGKNGGAGIEYSFGSESCKLINDRSKAENYINPMASFSCELERDKNGCISKLTFTQE